MGTPWRWGLLGIVGLALVARFSSAADVAEEGFQPLFNGTDLAGWQEVQGKPGSFRVENGILLGERNRTERTAYWLSTQQTYSDFELRLEYMLKPGGNSGVFVRAPHVGRTSREGMEIQLLDDGANRGTPTASNTGAVYQAAAPSAFVARPAGEWNAIAIICQGDHVTVELNGKRINDVHMNQVEALRNRPREGYIGLSAHTDVVKFRNVRIRPLKASG